MLRLKPFGESDIEAVIGWIPDAAALLQWAGPTLSWPLTRDQLARDVAAAAAPGSTTEMYAALDDGEHVGHIEIRGIDRTHRNAMLGRVLIAPHARGRRLADPLVQTALHRCFAELNLHRVGLRVFAHNASAIHCYERAGFITEGRERDTKLAPDGTWWNACTMAILEDDWRRAQAP